MDHFRFRLLDFLKGDLAASPVVQLGGRRRFVRRDLLGKFQRSTTLQIGGDTNRSNLWQQVE